MTCNLALYIVRLTAPLCVTTVEYAIQVLRVDRMQVDHKLWNEAQRTALKGMALQIPPDTMILQYGLDAAGPGK